MLRAEVLRAVSLSGVTLSYETIESARGETLMVESPQYQVSFLFEAAAGGGYSWKLPGRAHTVLQQQIGLLPPNTPINVNLAEGSAKVLLCLFSPSFFERPHLPIDWSNEQIASVLTRKNSVIAQICELIVREMANEDSRRDSMLSSYSNWLNIELLREVTCEPGGNCSSYELLEWRRRKICRMIDECEEMGAVDIEEIARACRMSAKYLMMQFKATTGQTLHQYIETVRIRRVKDMIENDDAPLGVIAERMGFCSASHMSTTFAKVVGAAPSRYRARCRAAQADQGIVPSQRRLLS